MDKQQEVEMQEVSASMKKTQEKPQEKPQERKGKDELATIDGVPIIAFLNSGSGGGKGSMLIEKLVQYLKPEQVFDLSKVRTGWRPDTALQQFMHVPNLRIVVCGGDGTMGWILSCIDRVTHRENFQASLPIAMMPLGTGNDLARTFKWGAGYSSSMSKEMWLRKVASAETARLDRWRLKIFPFQVATANLKKKLPPILSVHQLKAGVGAIVGAGGAGGAGAIASGPVTQGTVVAQSLPSTTASPRKTIASTPRRGSSVSRISLQESVEDLGGSGECYEAVLCNYFSIGMDAQVADKFHTKRNSNPGKFKGQLRNQTWYVRLTMPMGCGCETVRRLPGSGLGDAGMSVQVKRGLDSATAKWEEIQLPSDTRAVVFLNLQSYGGGRDLWGKGSSKDSGSETEGAKAKPAKPGTEKPSVCDRLMELVAFRTVNGMGCVMACNKLGMHAKRVSRVSAARIKIQHATHMQIDGEPWLQQPGVMELSFFDQSVVLRGK